MDLGGVREKSSEPMKSMYLVCVHELLKELYFKKGKHMEI